MKWLMRGLLLFAFAFANLNEIWSPDVIPNALLPFTLVREENVNYDEFTGTGAKQLNGEASFFGDCGAPAASGRLRSPRRRGVPPAPGPNDHVCSVFPPGMGLLALPFFLPFILAGAQALDLGLLLRVGHLAAAFYETIATLLLWSVLRRLLSERETLALVLLYALGTSVRTIASQALWQHAGVHLAIAFALWLAVRERDPSWRREFLAGVVLGVGGLVRQTTAFVGLAIAGPRVGATILALAGAAIGLVPLLLFNNFAFGAPFEQGYGVKPFDTPPLQGVYGLLLSPSRGLFVYEPWALFALAGLGAARLSPTSIARRLATFPFVWILFVVFYATYAEWWGGRVFASRFLDEIEPLLHVGLAWR